MTTAILWKRLDADGHDACRLTSSHTGWKLSGSAVFDHSGSPCCFSYDVIGDMNWQTLSAVVQGWIGGEDLSLYIRRAGNGQWLLNDVEQRHLKGLVDVDLGFTPATNLFALNRHSLKIGEKADAPAAYLSFPDLRLDRLEQSYERIDEERYAYAAPIFRYDEILEVSQSGFVTDYPGLWRGRLWNCNGVQPH